MPPLRVKLSLMEQFVKTLVPNFEVFEYLTGLFPKFSDSKFKAVFIVEPQTKLLMKVMS